MRTLILLCLFATALGVSAEERKYPKGSAPPELLTDTYTSTAGPRAVPPPADRAPYPDYRADDAAGDFDLERAAAFIDNAAVKWGRKHGCVTCHTNGHYLIAPAAIFRDRPAARQVRDFVEDWIGSWDDVGLPDTEIVVAPAAFLAINNMQTLGALRPATLRALGEAWRLQSSEGHWPNWVRRHASGRRGTALGHGRSRRGALPSGRLFSRGLRPPHHGPVATS